MTDLPKINPPNDVNVPWEVAIEDKFWYKLYHEHHYWDLWVEAIDSDIWSVDTEEQRLREHFSSYAIEVDFIAEEEDAGVCLRNFSWTPLGGWCLFRGDSSSNPIETWRLTLYEFDHIFDHAFEYSQEDYKRALYDFEDSDNKIDGLCPSNLDYRDVDEVFPYCQLEFETTSHMKYMSWFGC